MRTQIWLIQQKLNLSPIHFNHVSSLISITTSHPLLEAWSKASWLFLPKLWIHPSCSIRTVGSIGDWIFAGKYWLQTSPGSVVWQLIRNHKDIFQHWSWPWSWPRTGVQGLGGWLDRSWWVCGWLTVEQDSRVFQCIQIVIRTLSWARGHRLATSAEVIILSQVVSQAWTTCAGGLVPSDQIQTCNNLVGDLCP